MTPAQMAMIAKAEEKMKRAYARLLFSHSFYAQILYRHQRRADPSCDTMWIDGRTIGYNPEFVQSVTSDELVGTLAHEANHIADLHHLRREGRDFDTWQEACDHVVNGQVKLAGLTLPEGALEPIYGSTPEAVYTQLMKKKEQQQGQGGQTGVPQQGQSGSQQQQNAQGQQQQAPGQGTQQGQDRQQGQDQPGNGTEEQEEQDTTDIGEVRDMRNDDGTEMTAEEKQEAESEARVMIAQAARAAEKAGQMPANLAHHVKRVLTTVIDWREVLARFLDSKNKNDWSWTRPNPRYLSAGLYLPSLYSETYGKVALGIDTSGSMPDQIIDLLCAEVKQCLAQYAERGEVPELWVLWCDTAVSAQLLEDEDTPLRPQGRGGTDFAPVFQYVDRHELDPKAVIYATDGFCSSFGPPPSYPVLWIVTTTREFNPPFGEVAYMPQRLA